MTGPVWMSETVRLSEYAKVPTAHAHTPDGLQGAFEKGVGYAGFKKSLCAEDGVDSRPERNLANILDSLTT